MKKSESQIKNYRNTNEQTEVTVKRVYLNYSLGSINNSEFESIFCEFWKALTGDNGLELKGIREQLRALKNLTSSGYDLYMVSFENSLFVQKVFLINKEYLLEITSSWLIAELGDQVHSIQPPYEDFINEFIEEVLDLVTISGSMN